MSDAIRALEAQLRANPDDGEAWEVYADWLLDQGDRRGELIMLESLAAQTNDSSVHESIAALLAKHRAGWTPKPLASQTRYEWRHGFVYQATVTNLARRADIRLLGKLLKSPQARLLAHLELRFYSYASAKIIEQFTKLDLGKLRSLKVPYQPFGDQIVHVLAQQRALNLASLDLRYTGLTDAGLIELVRSPRLRGLRALYLQQNQLGLAGIEALASAPAMSELETLDLRYNAIDVACVRALASSRALGKLKTLHLYVDDLDVESLRALASSTTLAPELVRFWRAQAEARANQWLE